jgi:hypothetical protein
VKELNEVKNNLIVSEIVGVNEFYLQDPKSKVLAEITEQLSDFDPDKFAKLQ